VQYDDPICWLDPVFRFLDRLVHDYCDILYTLLVYSSIRLITWILSGGLPLKLLKGKPMPPVPPVTFIYFRGKQPPPEKTFDPFPPPHEPPCNESNVYG
jgi:hypothetical protein